MVADLVIKHFCILCTLHAIVSALRSASACSSTETLFWFAVRSLYGNFKANTDIILAVAYLQSIMSVDVAENLSRCGSLQRFLRDWAASIPRGLRAVHEARQGKESVSANESQDTVSPGVTMGPALAEGTTLPLTQHLEVRMCAGNAQVETCI